MMLGCTSLEKVIRPLSSLILQAIRHARQTLGFNLSRRRGGWEGGGYELGSGGAGRWDGSHQFEGQSEGVAGFLGVLMATRALPFFLSRPSHTRPTEDTSLQQHERTHVSTVAYTVTTEVRTVPVI